MSQSATTREVQEHLEKGGTITYQVDNFKIRYRLDTGKMVRHNIIRAMQNKESLIKIETDGYLKGYYKIKRQKNDMLQKM